MCRVALLQRSTLVGPFAQAFLRDKLHWPVLRDKLHWLRLRQRMAYKLCLLVYKSLHDSSPRYIKELVVPVARLSSLRRLRSASTLMLRKPLAKKKVGKRGFSVAAPAAWNDLPLSVKTSQSLAVFKSQLKTYLPL